MNTVNYYNLSIIGERSELIKLFTSSRDDIYTYIQNGFSEEEYDNEVNHYIASEEAINKFYIESSYTSDYWNSVYDDIEELSEKYPNCTFTIEVENMDNTRDQKQRVYKNGICKAIRKLDWVDDFDWK